MDHTATADRNFARSIDSPKPVESTLQRWIKFLRVELAPFPGRAESTLRLVLAVTAALIFSQTLRVPSTAISIYVIFFVFQDDSVGSTKIGVAAIIALTIVVGVLLLVAKCFVDADAIRVTTIFALLWASMFLSRILVLGVVGRLFAVVIAMFLMLSDAISRGDQLVRTVLYFWPIIGVSVGAALVVEWLWKRRPEKTIRLELVARLEAVRAWCDAVEAPAPHDVQAQRAARLRSLALAGSVRLRGLLGRLDSSDPSTRHRIATLRRAGEAVDELIVATAAIASVPQLSRTADEKAYLMSVSAELDRCLDQSRSGEVDAVVETLRGVGGPTATPSFARIDRALANLRQVSSNAPSAPPAVVPPVPAEHKKAGPFVPDAFSNPEYWQYAVKATLAVAICYVFITAVDWPGARTALITCVVTSLTTLGASTEKQALRFSGLMVGGLLGIGVVIFLIPHMVSIASLMVVIAAGTALAGWVARGGPRISYAGFQIALAFYLTFVEGYGPSTDLTPIRDRAVGIGMGIVVIAFLFRYLWPVRARELLHRQIPQAVGDLANLARQKPPRSPAPTATGRLAQMGQLLAEGALEPDERKRPLPDFNRHREVVEDAEAVLFLLRSSTAPAELEAAELAALAPTSAPSPLSAPASQSDGQREDSALTNAIGRLRQSMMAARVLFILAMTFIGGIPALRAQWEPFKFAPPSPTKQWDDPRLPSYRDELERMRRDEGSPLLIRAPGGMEIRLQPKHIYSLPELVDIAELVNPETRVAWQQARKAAIGVGLYQSSYYPQITFVGAIGRNELLVNTPSQIEILARANVHANVAAPLLDLKWLLFDFGGREASVNLSKQKLAAANQVFNLRHQQIILRVTKAYYALNTVIGKMRVARSAVESTNSVERAATLRLNTGLATQIDVLLSRQQAAQAVFELEQAVANENLARAELADSMGIRPTIGLQVRDISREALPSRLLAAMDAYIDRALVQRPDLVAKVANLRAANAEVRKARAELLPSIALTGNLQKLFVDGTVDPGPIGPINVRERGYGVFLNLKWPLFDGGANINKIRLAQSERAASEAELDLARDEAVGQVFRAYTNLRSSYQRRSAATALLSASDEAYTGTVESYKNGLATINDVLAARRGLTNAQEVEVANLAEIYTYWANLAFATGELGVKPSVRRTMSRGK
jgi:outer membrane protein TolC